MRKEIDNLVEAARKECAVVEKASHILWTYDELREAGASGFYQGPVRLVVRCLEGDPGRLLAVSAGTLVTS